MTDHAPPLRLTILGGTGPTGQHLTRRALEQGHYVTVVARNPEQLTVTHDRLRVMKGDVLDPASLRGAFDEADAVLSALGVRGNRPTTLYSDGIAHVLVAMRAAATTRFVGLSARPVSPAAETTALERGLLFPVLRRFFGRTYVDMARMERILLQSDSTWTVLRPPRLVNSPATSAYRVALSGRLPRARAVTRADLAQAMLDAIDNANLRNRAVAIAN